MHNNDFISSVKKTIEKYNMLTPGDHVIIGLSGGADSMSLLHALTELKLEYCLRLSAVHINHGLRGHEADADEAFVVKVCNDLGVALDIYSFDIKKIAKEEGITEEEAGRIKRYEAFAQTLQNFGADKIAVAHNLNDQAETILMRFIRGTGSKGLAGIPAVRGCIIRPLIELSRDDIEKYMHENNFEYRHDTTNNEEIYTRNKIRLGLIPYIKNEFNPDIINTLSRNAEIFSSENEYIETVADDAYKKCTEKSQNKNISIQELNKYHDVIKKRILRKGCMAASKSLKDISYTHINDILRLIENDTGKSVDLPHGLRVENSYGELIFHKNCAGPSDFFYALNKNYEGEYDLVYIDELNIYVTLSKNVINTLRNFNNLYTMQFDYDRINGNLFVRSRKKGDRINIGVSGSKKISRYLIDEKIPRQARDNTILLADEESVLWIVNMRASAWHRPDETTTNIITVQFWEENK